MKNGVEYQTNGKDTIFIVDPAPEFPGGVPGLMKYIRESIRYPRVSRKKGVEGRVIVKFTVDTTGQPGACTIMKSVSSELDAEAIRMVLKMPKWKPGEQHGKAIPVYYILPINFRLTD